MDLENNIWTSFWKWSSSQTARLWWGPCRRRLCVGGAGLGSAWLNFSLEDCPLPASKSDSFPPSCVPLPLLPTGRPSEQRASLAVFLVSPSQCWGGCQRLREERSKLSLGYQNGVGTIVYLGFLDLNDLTTAPTPPRPKLQLVIPFRYNSPWLYLAMNITFYFWIPLLTNLIPIIVRKNILKISSDSIFKASGSHTFIFLTKPALSYVFIT